MQLILLGINYRKATLDMRERFAFSQDDLLDTLQYLKASALLKEVIILSTCNRTEIYALSEYLSEARDFIKAVFCNHASIGDEDFEALSYTAYNKFAAEHLFHVAAGMDSVIFGEYEILRQVKEALLIAQSVGSAKDILGQLFISAIRAGKRVRNETVIGQGVASVGSLVARLIHEYAQSQGITPRILLMGTGKIGAVTLKHLKNTDYPLTLTNRSQNKAEALAQEMGRGHVLAFSAWAQSLADYNVVITCTSAPHFLIDQAQAAVWTESQKPVLLIDLSVPRNINPRLAEQNLIHYYDMDRLQQIVESSQENRKRCQDVAETILADEMSRFLEWFNTRDVLPTVQALYDLFHDIRQREIERGLKKYQGKVSEETQDLLERVTRAIIQKILHYPVVQLKLAQDSERKQQYVNALSDLFKLDTQDTIEKFVQISSQRHVFHLKHD